MQILLLPTITFLDSKFHCSIIPLEFCSPHPPHPKKKHVHGPENNQSSVTVPSRLSVASLGYFQSWFSGQQNKIVALIPATRS